MVIKCGHLCKDGFMADVRYLLYLYGAPLLTLSFPSLVNKVYPSGKRERSF